MFLPISGLVTRHQIVSNQIHIQLLSYDMRDLGVLFDSELTMKKHIAKVAAVCFFHIRRLRQIRRRVGKDVTIRLVLALITPRLDYCNSVFAGLPQSTLEPLQRVQNAAARLV